MKSHEVCTTCPNNILGCDEHLKPEGVGGGLVNFHIGCRHLTCELGLAQATRALRNHIREHGTIIHPVAFGSSHKPIGTRYVDASGDIYSEQNGAFYKTGQHIDIASIFTNWEIP